MKVALQWALVLGMFGTAIAGGLLLLQETQGWQHTLVVLGIWHWACKVSLKVIFQ